MFKPRKEKRKHIDDLTGVELQILSEAIENLHKLDKFDAQGAAVFPQGIDLYERFVQIHGDGRENGACLHESERLWFWHRAFLLHFENWLRATNPPRTANLTLPYWDWAEISSGKSGFPEAFETVPGLMFNRNNHSKTAKTYPPLAVTMGVSPAQTPAEVDKILNDPSWERVGGTIDGPMADPGSMELRFHDLIHSTYIGTFNKNTVLAVRDPIFWGHHANLDRLVDLWQQRHPTQPHCLSCDEAAYAARLSAGKIVNQGRGFKLFN